jgi:hypothetical protein
MEKKKMRNSIESHLRIEGRGIIEDECGRCDGRGERNQLASRIMKHFGEDFPIFFLFFLFFFLFFFVVLLLFMVLLFRARRRSRSPSKIWGSILGWSEP